MPDLVQTLGFGMDDALDGEGVFHLVGERLNKDSGTHLRTEYWIGRNDFLFKRAVVSFVGPQGSEGAWTYSFTDFGEPAVIKSPQLDARPHVKAQTVREEDVVIIDPVQRVIRGELRNGNCTLTVNWERMPGEPSKLLRKISEDFEKCEGVFEEGAISEKDATELGTNQIGSFSKTYLLPPPGGTN